MARPIWKGQISFGLVNIPVTLYGAESRFDLHFQMLDSRNHARVRYERVNEQTGEEVPWNEIVKAFEYDDDSNYVLLKEEDLKRLKAEADQTVEITDFVKAEEIDPLYFEKPYYLVPGKKGKKGYVLLRETLSRSGTLGMARVVIRSRQYLAALLPVKQALVLNLLRWPQELKKIEEYDIPQGNLADYKVSAGEVKMALALVETMTQPWSPERYHDEHREAMMRWIDEQVEQGKVTLVRQKEKEESAEGAGREESGARVVDMMELLKKSMAKRGKANKAFNEVEAATGTDGRRAPRARKTQNGRNTAAGKQGASRPAAKKPVAAKKK
jgi:DNA end-binding protein Ku